MDEDSTERASEQLCTDYYFETVASSLSSQEADESLTAHASQTPGLDLSVSPRFQPAGVPDLHVDAAEYFSRDYQICFCGFFSDETERNAALMHRSLIANFR